MPPAEHVHGDWGLLAELGRQPKFAHDWFVKYRDRVLFRRGYVGARRVSWGCPMRLRKLYYENAMRMIPGIKYKER